MSKEPSKLFGFTAGVAAGVLIAPSSFSKRRMPNAKTWQRSGTLGVGAVQCDFRWELFADGIVPLEQVC